MSIAPSVTGRSSDVRLHLVIGDLTLELGQIGPGSVILEESIDLPPCEAEIVMQVDSFERHWQVYLPDGVSRRSREVRTIAQPIIAEPTP